MQLEIWSDVACPWCALGTRRIAEALERFPGEVDVRYRSFELDPEAPARHPGDRTERIARKIGRDADQLRAMEAQMTALAAEDGLEFHFDRTQDGNTHDAHRLLHLAWDLGGSSLQATLKSALVTALFRDGEPIGEHEALRRVAVGAGLPEADVERVLGSNEYADAVRDDERLARGFGISGVPFFVIDRTYGISGAQPADVLVRALEEAAQAGTPSGNAR
ncbi:DsbA family oxidoreductase [Pseudonocardia ailaonensis]|uniref:DsbA family oxidoreductase n=1 Tax=Pseudonocardia ailaonensis TaxID=367279 RepID=A0ABN2N7Y3_9PSEU